MTCFDPPLTRIINVPNELFIIMLFIDNTAHIINTIDTVDGGALFIFIHVSLFLTEEIKSK